MTEFRRASGALEQLEKLVAELCSDAAVLAGGAPSAEARGKYMDARRKAEELAPAAEKMRRKCEARAELEALRGRLAALLPGGPTAEAATKAAQELVDAGGEGAAQMMPLLKQALELEGVATYGAQMVVKVLELLQRYDSTMRTLDGELAPKLADAAEAAAAAELQRRAEAQRLEAEHAADEERRQREDERRVVVQLLAENQQRLQDQQSKGAAERREIEEKEARRLQQEALWRAEEEAMVRAEQESEQILAAAGPNAACLQALAFMLAAPVGPYRTAVENLSGMLGGVASEPQDMRQRLIRVANEGFQTRLARRPGVWLFLRAVGFDIVWRESLPGGLAASLGLGVGPADERFLMLREPDMMTAYEEWSRWHGRVKAVASFLHELEQLAFQRTACLGQSGSDIAARTVISVDEVERRWAACCGG